jgi:hypothetical protein
MTSEAYKEFQMDLDFSIQKEALMDPIYKSYFQNVTIDRIDRYGSEDEFDLKKQHAGIDTNVVLSSGERIRVQEKWSRHPFKGLFLIEYLHVYVNSDKMKKGWIYTTDADYIFSVYSKSDLIKIYPVVQLKIAWHNNRIAWLNKYLKIEVPNPKLPKPTKYITNCILVPCDVLETEIMKVQTFTYQTLLSTFI